MHIIGYTGTVDHAIKGHQTQPRNCRVRLPRLSKFVNHLPLIPPKNTYPFFFPFVFIDTKSGFFRKFEFSVPV